MGTVMQLRQLWERVPQRLRAMSAESASGKRSPEQWSSKEELGHLLDSAENNHLRIVRAQAEDSPDLPGYDQVFGVRLHRYQERDWAELVTTWQVLNQRLLIAAENTPPTAWERTCTVAGSKPITLGFVLEDYIRHALHHLEHIGIRVDDLRETSGQVTVG